jgi:hypothetical protein
MSSSTVLQIHFIIQQMNIYFGLVIFITGVIGRDVHWTKKPFLVPVDSEAIFSGYDNQSVFVIA